MTSPEQSPVVSDIAPAAPEFDYSLVDPELGDSPEAPEVHTEPEMAAPSFTPDVDDGADNGPLVLSPPSTPPPLPGNFTALTFRPALPANAPTFAAQTVRPRTRRPALSSRRPVLPPSLRRPAAQPVHVDPAEVEQMELSHRSMEYQAKISKGVMKAAVASARVQSEVQAKAEGR